MKKLFPLFLCLSISVVSYMAPSRKNMWPADFYNTNKWCAGPKTQRPTLPLKRDPITQLFKISDSDELQQAVDAGQLDQIEAIRCYSPLLKSMLAADLLEHVSNLSHLKSAQIAIAYNDGFGNLLQALADHCAETLVVLNFELGALEETPEKILLVAKLLPQFKNLEELDLSYALSSGQNASKKLSNIWFAQAVTSLKGLKKLVLTGTHIHENIHFYITLAQNFHMLESLTDLKIHLARTFLPAGFVSPELIASLGNALAHSNLTTLDLNCSKLGEDPARLHIIASSLAQMRRLEKLEIISIELEECTLDELKHFFDCLSKIKTLKVLIMDNANIAKIPGADHVLCQALAQLPNLEVFSCQLSLGKEWSSAQVNMITNALPPKCNYYLVWFRNSCNLCY